MKIEFEQKYFVMLGKEYLIRSVEDEARVFKKQAKIARKTGKKPRITVSFRNSMHGLDEC